MSIRPLTVWQRNHAIDRLVGELGPRAVKTMHDLLADDYLQQCYQESFGSPIPADPNPPIIITSETPASVNHQQEEAA